MINAGKLVSFNNNCLDKCPEDLFLLNKNCIEACPENMIWGEDRICKNNDTLNHSKVMLIIYIIISGVLLSLILFFFYKRYVCSSKISNEKLIDEINSELIESKNIYD